MEAPSLSSHQLYRPPAEEANEQLIVLIHLVDTGIDFNIRTPLLIPSSEFRPVTDSGFSSMDLHYVSCKKTGLQWGFLTAALIYLYAPAFSALVNTWLVRPDFSHGFLILPISLYLVWLQREKLRHLRLQRSYLAGISVIIIAGAMLVLGDAASLITLQELSLPVMIVGLVLFLFGRVHLKTVGLPIAYLLFMIPFLDKLINPLHWPLQLLSAKMGVAFLMNLGFPALVQEQYIILPNITLEVAQACSGVKYLISIIAIGIPLAYITQKNLWSGIALVLSAVIIGVIANWIRVAAIGIWAYYGGSVLHGPFHVFQALFVAQLGFIALFVGAWILSKLNISQPGHVTPGPISTH